MAAQLAEVQGESSQVRPNESPAIASTAAAVTHTGATMATVRSPPLNTPVTNASTNEPTIAAAAQPPTSDSAISSHSSTVVRASATASAQAVPRPTITPV